MTRPLFGAAALLIVLSGGAVMAQNAVQSGPIISDDGHHRYTPEQKQQSDADVRTALAQLQSAASVLQGGDRATASADINTAHQELNEALPIYHGNREKSMHDAEHAMKALARNGKESGERASGLVNTAITFAQTALSVN